MLITKLKPKNEILSLSGSRIATVSCRGCSEVYYPEKDIHNFLDEISINRTLLAVIDLIYVCNADYLASNLKKFTDIIAIADTFIVFSCGVGVQTVSEQLESMQRCDSTSVINKFVGTVNAVNNDSDVYTSRSDNYNLENDLKIRVISACDTYPLRGYQGLMTAQCGCLLCGDCILNKTGGICPKTACSKNLTAGGCGGAVNGMCEVNLKRECGWVRINRKLGKDSL